MRQRSNGTVRHDPPVVEDFLKLSGGLNTPMRSEIGFPAHVE